MNTFLVTTYIEVGIFYFLAGLYLLQYDQLTYSGQKVRNSFDFGFEIAWHIIFTFIWPLVAYLAFSYAISEVFLRVWHWYIKFEARHYGSGEDLDFDEQ